MLLLDLITPWQSVKNKKNNKMAFTFSGFATNGSFNLVCPNPPPPAYYLWSWGGNGYGRLGLGDTTNRSSPVQVGSLGTWATVSAGRFGGTIAVKTDGTLWTWGLNGNGQLGLGNTTNYSSPMQIGALTAWSTVSEGAYNALAVKTNGTLWSWGSNYTGSLGLNDGITYRSSPTQVGALTTWLRVSASYDRHCGAIKTDGTLWTWGQNSYGRLGVGDTTNKSAPTQVGVLTNWSNVSVGYMHTLAIKTNGTIWAWGRNSYGDLGLGNTSSYSSPKQIGALTDWSSISANRNGGAAIKTNGTMWGWGMNQYGQLGDGTTANRSSPVQVGALTTWSSVSVGSLYVGAAIKTDGTLWAWGYNTVGQLGQGDTTNRSSPVQVGALTTWSSVSTGYNHIAAIGYY